MNLMALTPELVESVVAARLSANYTAFIERYRTDEDGGSSSVMSQAEKFMELAAKAPSLSGAIHGHINYIYGPGNASQAQANAILALWADAFMLGVSCGSAIDGAEILERLVGEGEGD